VGTAFANCLAASFYLLFYSLYDIRLQGLENYKAAPPALITINHKRDLDVPIVGSILHLHRSIWKNRLRPYFVARDDLFYPGFLTAHFRFLGGAGRLIQRVSLAPVMSALRAYPISHLVRDRIGGMMREIKQLRGDVPLGQVVKQSALDMFNRLLGSPGDGLGDVTVSDFLGHRFRRLHQRTADIGIFKGSLPQAMRAKRLEDIKGQLRQFAMILDEGNICLLAPEGQLSPDGYLGPVKSGLHRLVSMTRSNIRVIPVNTTYDFMTRRRMRIYVTVGPEISDLKGYKKTEMERRVQQTIARLGPVTLGQLGSEFLVKALEAGRSIFSESELLAALSSRIRELRDRGFRLEDRILTEGSLARRARDFLGYCLDKGIVSYINRGSYLIAEKRVADKMQDNNKWRQNPVRYSANELRSLLENG